MSGDPAAARRAAAALLADVEARTGVVGRLLVGCDDPRTWMEVYEPVPDVGAFRAMLEQRVAAHGSDRHAEGGRRHVECFTAAPF